MHPAKNGALTPEDAPYGSNKKIWWKCPKGEDHEWEASIRYRLHHKDCPYCINRKVSSANNLLKECPELAEEWHPAKRYGGCVTTNILGKRQLAKELQEDSPVLTVQK
tara:strand:- start:182 stop:505 length:324 start_codon:yes stop_codon:yes gene_type:complete